MKLYLRLFDCNLFLPNIASQPGDADGWIYDDGGQQTNNEWIFDNGQHTDPKEFKSLDDLSYGPEHYYTDAKQCTHKPKQPMNAYLKCTSSTNSCKVTCMTEYTFPNGETSLYITCEDGVWSELPSCERNITEKLYVLLILSFPFY